MLKETATTLFFAFCDGCILKTCTGSNKCKTSKPESSKACTGSNHAKKHKLQMQCQRSGLDWSRCLHLHLLSLCKFWSVGFLKYAQAQTNATHPSLKAPKPAQAQEDANTCTARCNVRGEGLIGLDVCSFCICLSLCRFRNF